jgi:hypothetical protein
MRIVGAMLHRSRYCTQYMPVYYTNVHIVILQLCTVYTQFYTANNHYTLQIVRSMQRCSEALYDPLCSA